MSINPRIQTLADAIAHQPNEKGIFVGNKEVYKENLEQGLRDHNAYEAFEKKLPSILKADTSVDEKKTAIVDAAYQNTLPVLKAAQAYDAEFVAAAALSLGTAAQAYVKENPEVNRVQGHVVTHGNNKVNSVYDHKYEVRIPQGKGEEPKREERYGRVVSEYVVSQHTGKGSTIADVTASLADKAAKALSK